MLTLVCSSNFFIYYFKHGKFNFAVKCPDRVKRLRRMRRKASKRWVSDCMEGIRHCHGNVT